MTTLYRIAYARLPRVLPIEYDANRAFLAPQAAAIDPITGTGHRGRPSNCIKAGVLMPAPPGSTRSTPGPEDLAERIRALSAEFAATLKENVDEIRTVWTSLPREDGLAAAVPGLSQIHDIAHSLAGAGQSLGFPRISQCAAPIDSLFRILQEKQTPLTAEEIDQIDLLIRDLEQAVDIPGEQVILDDVHGAYELGAHRGTFHVLLFGELDTTNDAIAALNEIGYRVCTITGRSAPADVTAGAPAVVLAPLDQTAEALAWLRQCGLYDDVPVVSVAEHSAFNDRLAAVRQGAVDFAYTPLEREDLFARLSAIEERLTAPPIRVVISEDDPTLAKFYQLTLERAGMDVHVIETPETMLDELSGMAADIIVMDLYLGNFTGLELAQIVRQFPAYTTVPILFLSTESRITLQLEARHLGADDFLVKPLKPDQLISAVTSRAQRYRDLKKLTDRDSLTGLLNHTNILRALDREISAAARTKTTVVMAMVDIDHFKKVNDTYGHAVGDQVILRVTHMIRNRLRRVDHVGRYGGEEFAVVMPNTEMDAALTILEELRETCASMIFESDQGPFSVTFSAGVANFPAINTGADITQAADEALYKAKRGGRNQIVAA